MSISRVETAPDFWHAQVKLAASAKEIAVVNRYGPTKGDADWTRGFGMIGALAQCQRVAASGSVAVASRDEVVRLPHWQRAFASERKDHRFYELVEDTIRQGFDYRYFVIRDDVGEVHAIQPFFILDQDLCAGIGRHVRSAVGLVRRLWPRFLQLRTLMVGCAVGEAHLDGHERSHRATAEILAASITRLARTLKAPLIVLKEFPARYRDSLQCFVGHGFARMSSMPNTRLNIEYANFDEYMKKALGKEMRRNLRRKFKTTQEVPAIEMTVIDDVTPLIKEVYPLYLQVYERSKLRFEKLTEAYFCDLGRLMPEKVRFFVWSQAEKTVAFMLCLINGDAVHAEYIGLEYSVALDRHLYFLSFRDVCSWAMANGFKSYRSSALNYDPKLHLKHSLDPLDLYVRHTSKIINAILRRMLPLLEPTRYDKTLAKFSNYHELWASR